MPESTAATVAHHRPPSKPLHVPEALPHDASDLAERLEQALDAIARLTRYPQGGRHAAWTERLRVNLPELRAFEASSPRADLGYLSPPRAHASSAERARAADAPDASDTPAGAASAGGTHAKATDPAHAGPHGLAHAVHAAIAQARNRHDLHAFISLAEDSAIDADAADVERRRRAGETLPLAGVPVAVKDLMAVAGVVQTNGTGDAAAAAPAEADALAVARLRAAGGIVIGTTNLHELAYGITSDNPHFGRVVNPHHPAHTPGGSSGGSAAAVAAGIVRIAVGTDTAGSIRIPAACCGVVGFKPSFDAVPRDGAQALGASLDHIGPIAASVADASLAFAVLAGDAARVATPAPLAGLRVGVPRRHFFEPLADDVRRAVEAAIARMRDDGARIVDVDVAGIESSAALQFVTLCSEATDLHWRRLLEKPETLGPDVRVRLEIGQFLPAIWYTRAQRGRADLDDAFAHAMKNVDVLVTPTLRIAAPRLGATAPVIDGREIPLHTALTSLTMPFNLTGMPALTLPCGLGENGAPIGVQIAARRGDDWRVLDAGARLEELIEPNRRRKP